MPDQVVSLDFFVLFKSSLKILISLHEEMPDGSGPCFPQKNAPS